jgi:hypothetical protein
MRFIVIHAIYHTFTLLYICNVFSASIVLFLSPFLILSLSTTYLSHFRLYSKVPSIPASRSRSLSLSLYQHISPYLRILSLYISPSLALSISLFIYFLSNSLYLSLSHSYPFLGSTLKSPPCLSL